MSFSQKIGLGLIFVVAISASVALTYFFVRNGSDKPAQQTTLIEDFNTLMKEFDDLNKQVANKLVEIRKLADRVKKAELDVYDNVIECAKKGKERHIEKDTKANK